MLQYEKFHRAHQARLKVPLANPRLATMSVPVSSRDISHFTMQERGGGGVSMCCTDRGTRPTGWLCEQAHYRVLSAGEGEPEKREKNGRACSAVNTFFRTGMGERRVRLSFLVAFRVPSKCRGTGHVQSKFVVLS